MSDFDLLAERIEHLCNRVGSMESAVTQRSDERHEVICSKIGAVHARIGGVEDAVTKRLDSHSTDIDDLRKGHAKTREMLATVKAKQIALIAVGSTILMTVGGLVVKALGG